MDTLDNQEIDKELLELASAGDREAFSRLYQRYINNIYRFINSLCYSKEISEEITQELFVKLWENREHLKYVTSIKSYLYRSAKNLLLNHLQKKQAEQKSWILAKDNLYKEQSGADSDLIYKDYLKIAEAAIKLLPAKRKQIFELRLMEDLSLTEIAAQLSISKSVVKKQLYMGITFVRKYLYKHGEFPILCALLSLLMLQIKL